MADAGRAAPEPRFNRAERDFYPRPGVNVDGDGTGIDRDDRFRPHPDRAADRRNFMVGGNGAVLEADLGPDTLEAAADMFRFAPT
jgi:hypothetical protein